jgi:hypothetical protein
LVASSRFNSTRWRGPSALLTFLLGYCLLLVVVSHYYLLPALAAMRDATGVERQWLSASSALLLVVVLFILGVGIVLAFRVSRFFFPSDRPPATRTTYVDAWTESSRRMSVPPDDEDDSGEESH